MTNQDRPLTPDNDSSEQTDSNESKKPWEPMKLTYTGEAKDVVQFPGGGKLSTAPADPGDPKKPTGQG
ncbi:MAG TPA: hypothetical protein VGJ66_03970 [Pyrinomonadaceae bacterium]